jgi:hypothetical protein
MSKKRRRQATIRKKISRSILKFQTKKGTQLEFMFKIYCCLLNGAGKQREVLFLLRIYLGILELAKMSIRK